MNKLFTLGNTLNDVRCSVHFAPFYILDDNNSIGLPSCTSVSLVELACTMHRCRLTAFIVQRVSRKFVHEWIKAWKLHQNSENYADYFGIWWQTVARPELAKIQDGGPQTGSVYIFASGLDSRVIPTAIPMFFRSSNPTELVSILWNQTGSWKFKMAASKPEVDMT